MMNSLWIAKTGMEAQQTNLDVISHNLANVSTTGYKKVSAQFQDLMYLNLRQVGAQSTEQNQLPTGLQLGLGVRTAATSRNFADGGRQASTGTYDVAIDGKGFFSVTMPDGTTGYTRDGSFKVLNGQIVTNNGYPVDGGITIPNGTSSVTISAQGEVSVVVPPATAPTVVGTISVTTFPNPAGLEPRGQNLFTETVASGQPTAGTPGTNGIGSVMHGYLENSNVSAVGELVTMIQAQRAYEMNSKAIQTSDQMLAKLSQL
jgi:flagellar basal-body rod protein FlgG